MSNDIYSAKCSNDVNNISSRNNHYVSRYYHSPLTPKTEMIDDVENVKTELHCNSNKYEYMQYILDEFIHTEETYVENLWNCLRNYGNIFACNDLPMGLVGQKYVLLGNIRQLTEFHHNHFLPMLQRNRDGVKRIFDKFQLYIDDNYFYGYVIYTMNIRRSLRLCDMFKNYFELKQTELKDKLGIKSFLMQPIQRMARYPLLLNEFLTKFSMHNDVSKTLNSCRILMEKLHVLLRTINESESINDIVDCDFNILYQGKLQKISEFFVVDHTQRRSYHSKVFLFDKCVVYTEIIGKELKFHGRYTCDNIGIDTSHNSFITLFNHRREQQTCEFHGVPQVIEEWMHLLRSMITTFAKVEKKRLAEMYLHRDVHHRVKISQYRDVKYSN